MTTTEHDFTADELAVAEPNLRVEAAGLATQIVVTDSAIPRADFTRTANAILKFLEAPSRTVPDAADLDAIWLDDDGNLEWLAVIDNDLRPWLITVDEDGDPFATSYRVGDPDSGLVLDDEPTRPAHRLTYPLRIIATSNS